MARWSREVRAAYEAEREALLYFLFFDRCKVFQSDRKFIHEGTRILFSSQFFRFHFHCLCGAAVPCLASSFIQQYIQQAHQKRKIITLPRVCKYVRHVSERRGRRTSGNRPRREAYVASELFSPEAWRQDSLVLSSRQFATTIDHENIYIQS